MDPVGTFKLEDLQREHLQNLFNSKFNFVDGQVWMVDYPVASRSIGKCAMECGPFVCFYAEAFVKGWSFKNMPDLKTYRWHLINLLVGQCNGFADKRRKKCYRCEVAVLDKVMCSFCMQKAHLSCLKSAVIRGKEYLFCT